MNDLGEVLGIELQEGEENEIWRHWAGMPEYYNENLDKENLYTEINVKVKTKEDLETLSERIGTNLTHKTRSMWYPPKPPEKLKNLAWIEENDLETYWDQIEEILE